MRRTLVSLSLSCLALPVAGAAADLALGYSYESTSGSEPSVSRHGWNASGAIGLQGSLSFEADVSGHYGTSEGVAYGQSTLMAGPRFSFFRGRKSSPFVHALFGLLRERASVSILDVSISESENRFGALVGGGLDVRLRGPWALRLQGDYEYSSRSGEGQSGFRAGVGVAYRLGQKNP